jgi:RNA polymerase sigma-70 factor (ECF subfamily)
VGKAEVRRRTRMDDGELGAAVGRARDGDEAAFGVLYREVHPMLLGYLRALVGDDADDVASQTWHDVVRDLPGFRGDGHGYRGWAAAVARRRALDHPRRTGFGPRTDAPDESATEPPAVQDPAGVPLGGALNAPLDVTVDAPLGGPAAPAALDLIAGLPQDQAEAVLLRVVLGLNAPMTAKVLGKRQAAVRTAAHLGLQHLAARLGDFG